MKFQNVTVTAAYGILNQCENGYMALNCNSLTFDSNLVHTVDVDFIEL